LLSDAIFIELRLVTDYHYGRLGDNNYLTETPQQMICA